METTTRTLRAGLPPLPPRMQGHPVDARGYPVPWFVHYVDGVPDHRIADGAKHYQAVRFGLCWMCGQKLGSHKSFVMGSLGAITRNNSEPASHIECARYAVMACPFMTRPHAKRRDNGKDQIDLAETPGHGIMRNPGVYCLWTTKVCRPFQAANGGLLFELGDPTSTEWYAEGRLATRAEIDESIRSGLPKLAETTFKVDKSGERKANAQAALELGQAVAKLGRLLDLQFGKSAPEIAP